MILSKLKFKVIFENVNQLFSDLLAIAMINIKKIQEYFLNMCTFFILEQDI